jgi:hypothetical protein
MLKPTNKIHMYKVNIAIYTKLEDDKQNVSFSTVLHASAADLDHTNFRLVIRVGR